MTWSDSEDVILPQQHREIQYAINAMLERVRQIREDGIWPYPAPRSSPGQPCPYCATPDSGCPVHRDGDG